MDVEGKNNVPSVIAAAHELKSPLSLIRQLSLILEDESLTADQRSVSINRIYLTTQKALRLTSDLTRAYNLNDPTLFPLSPISPLQVCNDLLYDMKPYIEAKGKSVAFYSPTKIPLVISNADLLGRILSNFLDNAINYTFENEKMQLNLKVYKKENKVRFGLRDFGPAIKASYFEDIKNGMTKNAEVVHARPASSGLGIYISSQFAEIINSKIGVIRHRNGATFYVDVPISSQLKLFEI